MRPSKRRKILNYARDLWRNVLAMVESPRDLLQCRLVSKEWTNLASHNSLWGKHIKRLPKTESITPLYRYYIRASFFGVDLKEFDPKRAIRYFFTPEGIKLTCWLHDFLRPRNKIQTIRSNSEEVVLKNGTGQSVFIHKDGIVGFSNGRVLPYDPIDWVKIIRYRLEM